MKKIIIPLVATQILLCGCSFESNDKTSKDSNNVINSFDADTEINAYDFDERYAAYQKMYPDKSVLVWLTDSYVRYEAELNQYLADNDYDYLICFKTLDMSSDYGDTYIRSVKSMSESNVEFDILDSFSVVLGSDVVSNSYYYLAESGLLTPLDKYLKDEQYSDIYNLMPEKYWDSYKYKGHVYGVDNSFSSLCSDSGMLIYNNMLDQSGVSSDEFSKPIDELEPVFKKIYESCGKPFTFNCEFWTYDIFPANYPLSVGVALSENKAVNVFERSETLEYYMTLEKYAKESYISVDVPTEISAGYNIERKAAYGNTLKNNITEYTEVYNKKNNYICSPTNAVGVYSNSKNKDMAADAVLNVLYNKDINNIITYGTEGVHYDVQDGKAVMRSDENGNTYRFDPKYNDPSISYAVADESGLIAPMDYYSAYESAVYLDGCGFLFDGAGIKDKYISVVNKICEFAPPYADEKSDIKTYINDFNDSLYSAGMQEVLDEINKQLEEYNETDYTDN